MSYLTNILITVDGSEEAELAARAGLVLANLAPATVTALYISDDVPIGDRARLITYVIGKKPVFKPLIEYAEEHGIGLQTFVQVGEPAERLVATANTIAANGIVLSPTGRGKTLQGVGSGTIPGSVARKVLQHAPCPVLFMTAPAATRILVTETVDRILIANDGSACARAGISHGLRLAQQMGLSVTICTVLKTPHDRLTTTETENLQYGLKLSEMYHVMVEKMIRSGEDIPLELVRAAEQSDADLLVMGTHGVSGLKRMLLGSVSDAVLRQALCPVLLVRSETG